MASKTTLPSRFPIGTKFVIEGRAGGEGQVHVSSRYLEFPDGTLYRLPARVAPLRKPRAARHNRRRRSRGH